MRNRVTGFILPIVFALLIAAPAAAQTPVPVATDNATLTNNALPLIAAPDIEIREVTPVPTPTVIEIPEGGADVTDTGDVIVIVQKQDEGKNVVIIALFALVIALLAVVVWQADRLAKMIPAPLVPVLEKGADALLGAGQKLADDTPTPIDNSALDLIRQLKEMFFEALRRPPTPAEAPTPDTTTVTAPAGSTTVISPPAPTAFADPRPTDQGAFPSHPIPQSPLQPSPEAVRQFTEGDITPAVTPEGETVG